MSNHKQPIKHFFQKAVSKSKTVSLPRTEGKKLSLLFSWKYLQMRKLKQERLHFDRCPSFQEKTLFFAQ